MGKGAGDSVDHLPGSVAGDKVGPGPALRAEPSCRRLRLKVEDPKREVLPGRGRPRKNRALALARPTGVGRALATCVIPIEGRDEWLAAARRLA